LSKGKDAKSRIKAAFKEKSIFNFEDGMTAGLPVKDSKISRLPTRQFCMVGFFIVCFGSDPLKLFSGVSEVAVDE